MNFEKYLPIGSVVLLEGAQKRVMITGFAAKAQATGETLYDYIGCLYPEGVISSEQNLLFNHDKIVKIFYLGYSDDEEKALKIKLKNLLSTNNSAIYTSVQNDK